jgi:lysophospholipase L1-like esterase
MTAQDPQSGRDINQNQGSDASSAASSFDESQIIVVEDLFEPILEEAAALASSVMEEAAGDASSAASTEEKVEDKIEMVFIGDSQMANGRSDGTDLATLVSKRVPNSVSYNLGIGGTTASLEITTSDLAPATWTSSCFMGIAYSLSGKANREKVLSDHPEVLDVMNKIDPKKVDYYFIEYGANDFFTKAPLDISKTDVEYQYSYYGGLCTGIEELKAISPNAQIVLMSPFYGVYKDGDGNFIGDTYVVSNGIDTLANYARKTTNVIEDEQIMDFDCMFMSKCDLYLDTVDEYLMDGIHLSLKGRQAFARQLAHIPNWQNGYEPFAYLETDFINIADFDPDEYYRYDKDMLKEYYPDNYEKMQKGEYLLAPPQ